MSAGLALGARIVLAAVFVVAATLKLRDRRRVVVQMTPLVGAFAAPLFAAAVPLVEVALAVALLVARDSSIPGWAAVAVLLAFTLVLVRAHVRHVPCPCFGGAASATPVGAGAVLRNGVLLALAVLSTGDA